MSDDHKRRILIVDDEIPLLKSTAIFLNRRGGYEVITAENGQEGLDCLFSNSDIGLVLTDHSMPATPIDGLELVRRIQAHDQYRNLPIIVYSGGTTNRSEALKAGANDFIEKPYTIGILLETIGKYLSPKSQ